MQEEDSGDRYGNLESSCQGIYMEGPEMWDLGCGRDWITAGGILPGRLTGGY